MIPSLSLVILSGLWPLVEGSDTREATWSSTTYGPDGPWRAVQCSLGGNSQIVDLYPGDSWASLILLDSVCSTPNLTGDCLADRAGTFNIGTSGTTYIPSGNSNDTSDMTWATGSANTYLNKAGGNLHALSGELGDYISLSSLNVPNVSITGIYEAYQTYPNGKQYPVEVGTLSMGGTSAVHLVSGVSYNLFTGYSWKNDWIDSYSWGMHIGSVDPDIEPSLVMGGFDQTRAIGNISSQELVSDNEIGLMQVTLSDIGLGVAEGASPWSFESMDNLFRQDGSTVSRASLVEFSPTRPYLYLPGDTCNAIAEHIPVTFNEDLGLYFWNTDDSSYKDITTSPAYLSFTFVKNDGYDKNQKNITIKVPFNLLKLTLQSPLVEKNTTYFPCYPTESDSNENGLQLGRAFLQATFLAENWFNGTGDGYWFFAQAPGPVTGAGSIKDIDVTTTELTSSVTTTWEETWSGWWTPLSKSGNATGSGNSTSGGDGGHGGHGGGLSQGAKIGIGIGCGVAGALILCAAGFMIARCMKKDKQTATPVNQNDPEGDAAVPMELSTSGNPRELSGTGPLMAEHNAEHNPEHNAEVISDAKVPPPPPWTPAYTTTATSTTGSVTMSSNVELHSGEVAAELP